MARNTYSIEFKNKIITDWRSGLSRHKLSEKYSLNRSVISRLIKKYQQTGNISTNHTGGRPRKTTRQDDSRIKRQIQSDPTVSSNQLKSQLNLQISARTIRRRAIEAGLFSRRPARKPFISPKNRTGRLEFAKAHLDWTVQKWKTVLFSDESKYNLKDSDGMRRVRRPKGQRLNPKYCIATTKYGGGNVMVWGCFSGQGIGPIHRIEGIMDRFMYTDILKDVMLPYAEEEMPLKWRFQHDNDPKHTSQHCKTWLQQNGIEVLKWPAQSPDLNPIENLWEIVNTKINRENCTTKVALFEAIKVAWYSISADVIGNLISSMPKRCAAVIQSKGFATKY